MHAPTSQTSQTSAQTAAARAAGLGCWETPVRPVPLPGGISNSNFSVEHGGRRYVVRIGDDVPEHAVWRFNELTVARAAHAAGLSPAVRHHEPGALVLDFIVGGRPLAPAETAAPETLARIVELTRRCHRDLPLHLEVPGPMFWVFHANRRYARQIERDGGRLRGRLPALMEWNDACERQVGTIRPVFCHNDLLAANLIDDGERLWLIDWEYGGWNDALFDLANLASNNGFHEAAELQLLALYFGEEPRPERLARFAAMKAASLLRETLWSLVAERYSHLDFDYVAYSDENLSRFERAVASLVLPAG